MALSHHNLPLAGKPYITHPLGCSLVGPPGIPLNAATQPPSRAHTWHILPAHAAALTPVCPSIAGSQPSALWVTCDKDKRTGLTHPSKVRNWLSFTETSSALPPCPLCGFPLSFGSIFLILGTVRTSLPQWSLKWLQQHRWSEVALTNHSCHRAFSKGDTRISWEVLTKCPLCQSPVGWQSDNKKGDLIRLQKHYVSYLISSWAQCLPLHSGIMKLLIPPVWMACCLTETPQMLLPTTGVRFWDIFHVFSSQESVTTSPQRYPFCCGRWVGNTGVVCTSLQPKDVISGRQWISSSGGTIIYLRHAHSLDCGRKCQICNFLPVYCILIPHFSTMCFCLIEHAVKTHPPRFKPSSECLQFLA
jgi:hypothetical protein